MPELPINRPFDSSEPSIRVDNRLAVGVHRFALTVIDDRGLESLADTIDVEVQAAVAPPPIVRPVPVPPPVAAPVIVLPPRPR